MFVSVYMYMCIYVCLYMYIHTFIRTYTHMHIYILTTFTFCLPFCGPNVVNHFFWDVLPILSLACAGTQNNNSFCFVCISRNAQCCNHFGLLNIYLKTILNLHSVDGRQKAFSACSSHLSAVTVLYGTLFFIHI